MHLSTAGRLASKVIRRVAAEHVYQHVGIDLTRPSDIRATLTERCNYRCAYCYHWRQESYTDEMTLAEWQAALLSVRDYVGRFAVQFLGGEPMLLPWFADLAGFCSREGIDWGVVTNGSALGHDRIVALIAASPLNIDVSLDSRDGPTHDHMRGVKGSMSHVSRGIERLVSERQRTGARTVVRLKPTVSRQSIGTLEGIVTWALTLPGVLVDFSPVRLSADWEKDLMYPRTVQDFDKLQADIDCLVKLKTAGAPIETSVSRLRGMIPHFREAPSGREDACRVGLRTIDIRPNGEVKHCFQFGSIGNIRQTSMRDLWRATERRKLVDATLACPLIQASCSASCLAHRSLRQDIVRGVQFLRATRG